MNTYFIRHTEKMAIDDGSMRNLFEEGLIAVHFPHSRGGTLLEQDNDSIDPDDYAPRRGRRAITILKEIADNGGYVAAEYRIDHEIKRLVGYIPPGQIELIRDARWRGGFYPKRPDGHPAVLKSLGFENYSEVSPGKHLVIFAGRPRQGTLRRWPGAGERIQRFVTGEGIQRKLDNLTPDQQETLCSEFLKETIATNFGLPQLAHLLLPLGRTLKDIDIYGVSVDEYEIFAQVTHYSDQDRQFALKLRSLKSYPSDSYRIMFCMCDKRYDQDEIIVFPLAEVYDRFVRETEFGHLWEKHSFAE
jgi:hypothetical protein